MEEIGAHRREVANASVEGFLEAVAAWVADMDGYFANQGAEPPVEATWQLMAMAIEAGLVYE